MRKSKFFSIGLMLVLATLACLSTDKLFTTPGPNGNPAPSGAGTATTDPRVYYNSDYGVRLRYPDGWTSKPGDSGYTTVFMSPNQDVYSALWIQAAAENDTPQNLVTATRDDFLKTYPDLKMVQDFASKVGNGVDAWTMIFTATTKDGELKFNITAAIYGGQTFFLVSSASPEAYDRQVDDLNALISSMTMDTPALFGGIPRDQALIYEGGESTDPRTYDPATTHGSGDKLVFSGLVAFDPKLNLIPDLAESWDLSADGTVYTFHLRQNARFHDGRPVTAQDFIYSWERAANASTQSETVLTYLGDIVGVQEMNAGKADHISGLKALDQHTLQVTIDAPKPYFLLKLTYPTGYVVDKSNVESGKEWYRTPNGTGPYKLTRWDSFKVMIYERNKDFYLGPPAIPYIIVRLYSGEGLRLYETGDIDVTGVSSFSVPRVTDPKEPLSKEVLKNVSLCTSYIVLDVAQPPFDDLKVRQAFALAFDRQKYIQSVTNGVSLPAEGLYPPGLPGYDPNFKGLSFDPQRARQLLKESKYGGPAGLPPIVFTDSGFGTDLYSGTAALAQMWQKTLDVSITIENIEPNQFSHQLHAGNHGQIFSTGWCADYPDPENFADALFHTGAQQNEGHYSNPQLDAILEQARTERDVNKRMALYQQAQQIIVQDVPVIFTTHPLSYMLVKPYVKGYTFTSIDTPLERYLWLDWSNQPK